MENNVPICRLDGEKGRDRLSQPGIDMRRAERVEWGKRLLREEDET